MCDKKLFKVFLLVGRVMNWAFFLPFAFKFALIVGVVISVIRTVVGVVFYDKVINKLWLKCL